MQMLSSKSTTPLPVRCSALVGQIFMHGASSQWLHRMTVNDRPVFGNDPVSTYFTHVRLTPIGTSCSLLHATVQAWHPIQESLSSTNPSRVMSPPRQCRKNVSAGYWAPERNCRSCRLGGFEPSRITANHIADIAKAPLTQKACCDRRPIAAGTEHDGGYARVEFVDARRNLAASLYECLVEKLPG